MTLLGRRFSRRQTLGWLSGGLAGAGTFLVTNALSGSESPLPRWAEIEDLMVAGGDASGGSDPGEIDFASPLPVLLPSDFAHNDWKLEDLAAAPDIPELSLVEIEAGEPILIPIESIQTGGLPDHLRDVDTFQSAVAAAGQESAPVASAVVPQAAPNVPIIGAGAIGLRRLPLSVGDPYPWLPPTDRVVIASVGIDAKVVTVGVTPDGYMATPPFAAGHYAGSAHGGAAGNVVLSAHNDIEGGLFRPLPDTPNGAEIQIYRGPAVFTYLASYQIKVWEEGAPDEVRKANARYLKPTRNAVCTLITCVPLWVDTHRWIVRSLLVDAQVPAAPSAATLFSQSG